jgi:hypothetical protein
MNTTTSFQNSSVKSQPFSSSLSPGLLLQRKCACGGSVSSSLTGECEECKNKRLQTKLSIGASNDPLEQEADRVADQVLATSAHPAVSGTTPRIQRNTAQTSEEADTAPASVDRVLASSGRPLDPALQQDMGNRFSYDFSRVRVHSGATAEQSARDVNANAYTVGHNIVFGAGQYSPGAQEGRRLLAHELTHVVQQGESHAPSSATQTLRAQPKKKTPAKKTKPKVPMTCGRPSRKVAGNEITQVNLDVGAHTLTIDWKDPKKIPSGSAGTHNISPGTGLCCKDCNDDKVSQTSGSLCTPKGGSWPVSSTGCALSGHPTAKNPTYFQRGGIAIHSGNTSSPPRSHGCSRTSVQISELIHDNVVKDQTQIASSGTWTSTKCYMKESTDELSNRKDVCDGDKLKSKDKDKKPKPKPKQYNKPNAPEEMPKQQPKPAPPPAAKDVPVAEAPQLDSDDLAVGAQEMVADGPGPDNESLAHENIGYEFVDDTDLSEETA